MKAVRVYGLVKNRSKAASVKFPRRARPPRCGALSTLALRDIKIKRMPQQSTLLAIHRHM